jgi:DNA replication and repair protein RecF
MYVERLRLTDFRNYHDLDLALPRGLVVFTGRNAQGKSNLLEAVALIATSKSFRTATERETVRWGAGTLFARVDATVARRRDELHVEVVVADIGAPLEGAPLRPAADAALPQPPAAPFRKRIKVNGTPRRAMDLLGQVTIVVFAPTDLDLVVGPPAQRRRFLDMTLCQVHPVYCRTLSQYQKVVAQRAALLRRIKDGEDSPHALGYWDDQLARLAVPLLRERAAFLGRAEATAARVYRALSHDAEADDTADPAPRMAAGEPSAALRLVYRPSYEGPLAGDEAEVVAAFKARLPELRRREIAQGANVLGPHRDDLAFIADGVDLSTYGSRGQQRSVALALKLAELAYIEAETGDQPILLLDDVLSELDVQRRADLLAAVRDLDQVLLTTTDATSLPPEALARAHVFQVRAGAVTAVQ